ncbi:MAG: hypothetical protein K2Q09_08710, partial [Phycisphaerales bacterium]|nr:hypothetical protein [Phycisphaerales bacterium]
ANRSDVAIVSSSVSGGTIGSMAGTDGTTHVTSSSVTLQGVTVSRQLSVDGNGAASIAGSMTLSNNAVVTVNTSATYQGTSLRAAGTPAVINGTGTVRLNASTSDPNTTANTALLAQDTSVPTGSFSFGPGVTVDGFGRIGDVPTVNAGRVSANVPGRVLRIDGVSHQNNGRYDSANGGVLQIVSTTLTQGGSGTVVAGDGSSVQFSGATLQGGTLTGEGSGVSTVTGSSTFGGNVTIGGPVSVAPSQVLTVAATGITNNSVVTVNTNGSYAGTSVQAGGLNSPINGTGEVRLNRSSSDPQATVGTADLRGLTGTSLVFGPGQRLSGSGRVAVDTTIDGTVSPGYPAGAVDFIRNEGVMTFTANGGVTVDITGPGTFDRVVNAGTMSVRGTLVVNTTQDLDAGMTFDIVTGGTVTGRFDQVIGNGLTSPKRFGARVDPGRVRVTVLCGLADIGGAGADANGDGALNNNDFIVFIDRFFNQDPLVDFGRAGGQQGSDGVFDNNDFIAFIDLFFAGCF